MLTQFTKEIDFTGKNLNIGLDIYKKSWSVVLAVKAGDHNHLSPEYFDHLWPELNP